MMRVGIVAQRENPRAASLADELRHALDVEVWLDESTASALSRLSTDGHPDPVVDRPGPVVDRPGPVVDRPGPVVDRPVEEMDACDLVVSIGGDGTFLFTARGAGSTPIMGVNLGEVGFLNAVAPEDAVETVREEVARFRETGAVRTQELPRVRARGDGWTLGPALNEVAVLGPQRGHGNGVGVEVRVDGALYTGGHADGILVATPTGSTAYNLSEGGPLVHPEQDVFVATEMCATDPMPSLVVDSGRELTVRVSDAERAVVVADGRVTHEVTPPTRVTLEAAAEPARIAGPPLDFFTALGKLD